MHPWTRENWLTPLFLLPIILGLSCTQYEFLTQEVYEQATYSNRVDILFVLDNSQSMLDEQEALAINFNQFIQNLNSAAEQERSFPHQTLTDAVSNYLFFLNNFNRYINFRLGMTTTEIDDESTPTPGISGMLIEPYPDDPDAPLYIAANDEDVGEAFETLVGEVQQNMAAVGEEKGLEAMRRAICQTLPNPEALDEQNRLDLKLGCGDVLANNEVGLNGDFLRDEVALAVIIISDEGDSSEYTVADYITFLDSLERGYSISAIVPTLPLDLEDNTATCNPEKAPSEQLQRYRDAVESSNGLLAPICEDFADTLDNIGALINNLLSRFKLRQVPQDGSIFVFVDGSPLSEDQENGWVFRPSLNSIEFTGTAIPDYGANIEVYYRVVTTEDPRSLPF